MKFKTILTKISFSTNSFFIKKQEKWYLKGSWMVSKGLASAVKLPVERNANILWLWDMVLKEVRYREYLQMHLSLITWNLFAQVHSIGTMIIKITSRNASWNCIMITLLSTSLRRLRKKYPLCLWRTLLLR